MVGALQRSSSMETAANRNPCNFEITIMPKRHARRSQILSSQDLRFGARDAQLPEHLVGDFAAFIGQEDFSARRIAGCAPDCDEAKSQRTVAGFVADRLHDAGHHPAIDVHFARVRSDRFAFLEGHGQERKRVR